VLRSKHEIEVLFLGVSSPDFFPSDCFALRRLRICLEIKPACGGQEDKYLLLFQESLTVSQERSFIDIETIDSYVC